MIKNFKAFTWFLQRKL